MGMEMVTESEFKTVTYDPKFNLAFKLLNIDWISKFFVVEDKDLEQLENPQECVEEGGQIFFVLKNGSPVATCALYKEADGVYELAKMAVSDSCKGKGLGSILMEECEKWARQQQAKEIFLLSNSSLEAAMGLYKKHGYEVFHRGDHPIYDRADIGMRKLL